MDITPDQVRHVARLARLAMDEDSVARMTRELAAIVGYVEQLQAVDTDGVEPLANVSGLEHVLRDDQPGPLLDHAAVLANAPLANEVAFLVPKAVER